MGSTETSTALESEEHSTQQSRNSLLGKCKSDQETMEDGLVVSSIKQWIGRKSKKTRYRPIKNIRRFKGSSTNNKQKKIRNIEQISPKREELDEKTEDAFIPDNIYYRPTSNSMYIPTITADMIQDDGSHLTVQTSSEEYFKYARIRQTTKNDHADPAKVVQIISAVRKRPVIWDQRLTSHQNLALIRRAWIQLDNELGIDEEYPLARRKQIWKSKKDYYSYALNTDSLGKWTFADVMEFYEPMVNFRAKVCLRPTVLGEPPADLQDKLILADKFIQCTPFDKSNVLTFVLKSLYDVGMADARMMEKHGKAILDIFKTGQAAMKILD
ncbi:unnamed protein product [Caenorhabditis nigoni]